MTACGTQLSVACWTTAANFLSGKRLIRFEQEGEMRSISDEIYIIRRLNYGIVKGKKVKVLEGAVTKHIDIARFRRGNGNTGPWGTVANWGVRVWMAGRGLLQKYWGGLNAPRWPWLPRR